MYSVIMDDKRAHISMYKDVYLNCGPIFTFNYFGQDVIFLAGLKEIKEGFVEKGDKCYCICLFNFNVR